MKKILTSLLLVALFFASSGEVSAQTTGTVVANAGIDKNVLFKTSNSTGVSLSGYFSTNTSGSALKYEWTQVSGPTVSNLGEQKASLNPYFYFPRVGTYELKLTVSSIANPALSSSDNVIVKVFSTPPAFNYAPTVYIGPNMNVSSSTFPTGVSFYADADDQNGTQLTYKWTQISGPSVASVNPNSSHDNERKYTAIFPKAGLYVFKVLVSDGVNTNTDGINNDRNADNYIAVSVHDTRQTITVKSPNGGEILKAGNPVNVQFNSSVVDRYHKLELMPELGTGNIVAGGLFKKVTTSGSNSFGFTLPASSTPGRYSAKVTAYDSDYQWGVSNNLTFDTSNRSFRIDNSSPVATTVPVVTFVSQGTEKRLNEGSGDTGIFTIKVKVRATGGDLYVSPKFDPRIYTSVGRQVAQEKYTYNVTTASNRIKTASGNYLLKNGEEETFSVTTIGSLPAMGETGSYRAHIIGISWTPTEWSSSFHAVDSKVFGTDYLNLSSLSTPPPLALKVISPNGGEVFTTGQNINAQISSDHVGKGHGIYLVRLSDGQGVALTGITNLSTSGLKTYSIPLSFSTMAGRYKLRVCTGNVAGSVPPMSSCDLPTSFSDISDSHFNIQLRMATTVPSVRVLNPNVSQSLVEGTKYTINWTANDAAYVDLRLAHSETGTKDIITNIPNTGSYNWTVSRMGAGLRGTYAIGVRANNAVGSSYDVSDQQFTIVSATQSSNRDLQIASIQATLSVLLEALKDLKD